MDQDIDFTNNEKFEDVWFTKNEAGQVTWKTTSVLSYFQKPKFGLHEQIPDVVEVMEMCLIMSRSQSDAERCGKLAKDVSEKRLGGGI